MHLVLSIFIQNIRLDAPAVPAAQQHYDLMPHKPAMPECPSTTFSNPSNASKLFSPAFTEEMATRRKGGQIFEEGTSSPDSPERHLRLQTDSCHQ